MKPVIVTPRAALFHGDASELGSVLPPNTADALVTDPPAGIRFMGKDWDGDKGGRDAWIAWLAATLAPAFAALKPGAHGLVWALPKTSGWTSRALEDAGFEVRDRVSYLFRNGYPKGGKPSEGTGTGLKPGCEDWWLVRKPIIKTIGATFAKYGTGALNIDACRIGADGGGTTCTYWARGEDCGGHTNDVLRPTFHGPCPTSRAGEASAERRYTEQGSTNFAATPGPRGGSTKGKWPNHVVVDEAVAEDLGNGHLFYYCPKPSRAERDAGLGHLPPRTAGEATDRKDGTAGLNNPRAGAGRTGGARNFHPTVKSIALMRWLVRLITPPGGLVIDPFAGSCTTGIAALAEGCEFVGIEREADYIPIAEGRLRRALAEHAAKAA